MDEVRYLLGIIGVEFMVSDYEMSGIRVLWVGGLIGGWLIVW